MSKAQLPVPPIEILTELLCALSKTVNNDGIVPIVRGSFLLRHWFGDAARPAADIDLECFARTGTASYNQFGTAVNYAKMLCMYAAQRYSPEPRSIEFVEAEVPDDGTCLWEYGTPGERCYTGWVWNARGKKSGLLQIDIADAGSYDLDCVSVADIPLVDSHGARCQTPAYTQEMLLAAKLSWIARELNQSSASNSRKWRGEFKDLFDAHLLVTRAELSVHEFEKAVLAVAAKDKVDWKALDQLQTLDYDQSGWEDFQHAYPEQVTCGPDEMLRAIKERVQPLLTSVRAHEPFLAAIQAEPTDEVPYLIYADWLQERADPRGDFLRLFILWYFHNDRLDSVGDYLRYFAYRLIGNDEALTRKLTSIQRALKLDLRKMSTPWLYQLFGSAERFCAFKKKIEA